jgi:adenosylcobinamide-GDP ribazoletransferase
MFSELLVALGFLTIVRVRQTSGVDDVVMGRAGAFFPLIGLLLGMVILSVDRGLHPFVPNTLGNVILVVLLAVLSRGFPLLGLAYSVEGLLGSQERQRSLEILTQRTFGLFAVLALLGILFIKICALDLLQGGYRGMALLLGPTLSRWAWVVMAYSSRPVLAKGVGVALIRGVQFREFGLASVLTFALVFAFVEVVGLLIIVPVAGMILGCTLYCNRRLGGVTGETLGALGEMIETGVFVLCVPLQHLLLPH